MSQGAPIATTANAGLQALGTGGQLAIHAWDQIASYLRRTRGEAHAALFAEPNPDPDRGIVDWYDVEGGEATPIAQLPAAQAEAASAELARLVTDIQADAARLVASQRQGDRFLGELLSQALRVPGPDSRRAIGTRPVLVAWGHARADGHAEQALLLVQVARRPDARRMRIVGPPSVQVAPARARGGWIAAAIASLLLFLLFLLLLLLDPLDWFRAPPPTCVADTRGIALLDELRREQDREASLRAEIARIAREQGDRRLACPAPAPAPEPPAAPAQPAPRPPAEPPRPNAADAERVREQGGQAGKVQVILAWENENDLDLHVECPGGDRIDFNKPRSCGGGVLDVDQNFQPPLRRDPVENIVWENDAPAGNYRISVSHPGPSRSGGARGSSFRVTVRIDGQPDRTFSGSVMPNQRVNVGEFTVAAR
jgi:hypothetical protein